MPVVQRIGCAYESTNGESFQVYTPFIGRPTSIRSYRSQKTITIGTVALRPS
jgi:hypothetical protein